MPNSLKNNADKAGLGPGSLVHVGDVHDTVTQITIVDYGQDHFEKRTVTSLRETLDYRDKASITWIIVEGLADATIIEEIGRHFDVHPLVLEDILNTHQRPKLEEYDDYLYIVLKSLMPAGETFAISYEQVSILMLEGIIFSFKEKADALLDPVIGRIENSRGRFRSRGPDYLVYAILDTIVDQNFGLMDQLEEALTALEDEIFSSPKPAILVKIQETKREIMKMRRFVSPIRELLNGLIRSDSGMVHESTHVYLRDVYDHVLRIIESLETHRDILSSLLEIYMSSISSRMNEVMKVLTVFASIFIPLTFITGIYGMNFENMPELKWAWAYPAVWSAFIVISAILLGYFRRKNWI